MKKFISMAMALILISGILTGCGCSADMNGTTVPTTRPTTAPTTEPTTNPTTAPTTAPTAQPTVPSSSATQPATNDTMPGVIDGTDGMNGTIGTEEMPTQGANDNARGMRRGMGRK